MNNYLHNFPYFHRLLELNDEWEYAVRYAKNQDPNLGKKAKIVGTGGKGVGKSTMLKYIANRLLQDGPVLWIDLDPGQAEFTLPGTVYMLGQQAIQVWGLEKATDSNSIFCFMKNSDTHFIKIFKYRF